MRVLNAYAGIGGNRHLWPAEWEVTAVEWDERVAAEYQRRYPHDTVIVADAHEYVMWHAGEFDAIWTSPPCPTHSRINNTLRVKPAPDPRLWAEIAHLRYLGLPYVVENVHTYYDPPQKTRIDSCYSLPFDVHSHPLEPDDRTARHVTPSAASRAGNL